MYLTQKASFNVLFHRFSNHFFFIEIIVENGSDPGGLVFSKRPDPALYIRKEGGVAPFLSYIRFYRCQAL